MQSDAATLERSTTATKNNMLKNSIGGNPVQPHSKEYLPVTDPSLGEEIAGVPLSSTQDVDDAVRAAKAAFPKWSAMPIKERAQDRKSKRLNSSHIPLSRMPSSASQK